MRNGIIHGILDNDAKGIVGKGTLFWMEVTVAGVVTRYEWGLLEELDGRFNRAEKTAPFYVALKAEKQATELSAKAEKQASQAARTDVPISAVVRSTIEALILAEPKFVADIKAGKEKALNGLIGRAMAQLKGSADALVIKKLILELTA